MESVRLIVFPYKFSCQGPIRTLQETGHPGGAFRAPELGSRRSLNAGPEGERLELFEHQGRDRGAGGVSPALKLPFKFAPMDLTNCEERRIRVKEGILYVLSAISIAVSESSQFVTDQTFFKKLPGYVSINEIRPTVQGGNVTDPDTQACESFRGKCGLLIGAKTVDSLDSLDGRVFGQPCQPCQGIFSYEGRAMRSVW